MAKYIALRMPETDLCMGMTSLVNYENMSPELREVFAEDTEILIFEAPEYDCTDEAFEKLKELADQCVKDYCNELGTNK